MEENKTQIKRPAVHGLDFKEAWDLLSKQEKNYAYHFTNASWAGSFIVSHQVSYESPVLLLFLLAYFEKGVDQIFQKVKEQNLEKTWEGFIIYTGKVLGNMGNYESFGNTKIVPTIEEKEFTQLVELHPSYGDKASLYRKIVDDILPLIQREIFNGKSPFTTIGFPEEGGVSAYYSRNMKKEDRTLIEAFSEKENFSLLNTRIFKMGEGKFVITQASSEKGESKTVNYEGAEIVIETGEFAHYLKPLVQELQQAKEYARSDIQREMLEAYIKHFRLGDVEDHKESQRKWIKDIGPPIETNIGFIETYLDPANVRAYYEGMVAIVDNKKSERFTNLVSKSTEIIPLLPWPPQMEKEEFLKPDFTSLEVVCFASSGCPLGINIPNYDDIRQEEGFKNVYLYNAMPAISADTVSFATPHQAEVLLKHSNKVYLLHVALHELMGHGVGKLFAKREDGSFNFPRDTFKNPLNQQEVTTFYAPGETWNSKFGAVSTSYEECRADINGIWLSAYAQTQTLFDFDPATDGRIIAEVQWLHYIRKGLIGLPLYNPATKTWGQAHTNGAFVFTSYMLENQDPENKCIDVVVKPVDKNAMTPQEAERFKGDEMFEIVMNVDNIMDEGNGRKLLRDLVMKVNTYKCIGDVEEGTKFYVHYSQVSEKFLKVRDIVLRNRQARRLVLNHNLKKEGDDIKTIHYPHTIEGLIDSFRDRFVLEGENGIANKIIETWKERASQIRVEEISE